MKNPQGNLEKSSARNEQTNIDAIQLLDVDEKTQRDRQLIGSLAMVVPVVLGMVACFGFWASTGFAPYKMIYFSQPIAWITLATYALGMIAVVIVTKRFQMSFVDFGLDRSCARVVPIGIGIAVGAIAFGLLYFLPGFLFPDAKPDPASYATKAGVMIYLVNVVIAPFCSEFIFRGFGYKAIAGDAPSTNDIIVAVLLPAVFYGLIGVFFSLWMFLQSVIMGVVYGVLRHTTNSLYPSLAAHLVAALLIGFVLYQ